MPKYKAVDYYFNEAPINLNDPNIVLAIFKASGQWADHARAEDSQAVNFMAQAKTAGIKTGLYHFLAPQGIAEQAALFLKVWNKCGGADIAAVDVEIDLQKDYQGRYGNAVWQSSLKTFLDLVSAGTGKTPLIYTSIKYWEFIKTRNPLFPFNLIPPTWTNNYPLWLSWYPTFPDNFTSPPADAIPAGWTLPNVWVWQYEEFGRSKGLLANDLNWISDSFATQLGAITPPPPPPRVTANPIIGATVYFKDGSKTELVPKV